MPVPFSTLKYKLIMQAWKLAKVERWLHRVPWLAGWLKPRLNTPGEDNDATIIPVHAQVDGGVNTVLPYQVLKPLIEQAQGHFILNACPCRSAEYCRTFPHDFGCLYLGPATTDIPAGIGRHVTPAEAITHLEQGIHLGLVPMMVHASFDAEMLSIDYAQMLAICFCCDCCCTVRHHLRLGPSTFDATIHRLNGLKVTVTADCVGCGVCLPVCPVSAITLNETLVIDQERCKGCGFCAAVCPQHAITLTMDEPQQAIEQLFARIRARTTIGL